MIDTAAVLTELRGEIASKPAHGRQDLLVCLAELELRHRVPEDDLDRALRLTMPQLLDQLFNRAPQLADAVRQALEQEDAPAPGGAEEADRDAEGVHHSMAVA